MYKKIIILFFFLTNPLLANSEYFLTLRNEKVYLRQGPSFDYPIKIFYTKKYLPVLVQDKSYNFRKIKDHENNSGWIHISQLSKKKAAIVNIKELLLFKNSPLVLSNIIELPASYPVAPGGIAPGCCSRLIRCRKSSYS